MFDPAGNLYGDTYSGGASGYGGLYKLTVSGTGWTESLLANWDGGTDGDGPWGPLVWDNVGNLYGATLYGGDLNCNPSFGCGVVLKVTP